MMQGYREVINESRTNVILLKTTHQLEMAQHHSCVGGELNVSLRWCSFYSRGLKCTNGVDLQYSIV